MVTGSALKRKVSVGRKLGGAHEVSLGRADLEMLERIRGNTQQAAGDSESKILRCN